MRRLLAGLAAALALAGCGGSSTRSVATLKTSLLGLSSPAFAPGASIPTTYTCSGRNISPPLHWSNVPSGTRELALEMIDLDAPGGRFVHWALAGIKPSLSGLAAGQSIPPGAVAGRNDFAKIGYGGPCPPPGKPHRYVITLLALKAPTGLRPGFSAAALPASRALAQGELTGTYGRA